MKIQTSRKAGFTLVEIMIVVAIIGLLAAIAIPNFVKARDVARTKTCINNLRLIDGAKQSYVTEKNLDETTSLTEANIAPYLGRATGNYASSTTLSGVGVVCPFDTTKSYTLGTATDMPTCGNYNDPKHMASLDPTKQ
jgi:prepilin-type N-terminal cleavage/methylation domain-containing protein